MNGDLQCLALRVFSMCLLNNIKLEVEWIPISANDRADFLSRIVDYAYDDWRVKRDYVIMAKAKWGPHSVDRFANYENAQLPHFYSRVWCPGTEGVVAFSVPILEVVRIPPCSQDYVFRSLRYDTRSKENVLSSKPLSPGRAREIFKEKLEAIGVDHDSCGFSNHSIKSGGATAAANLNVPDRLFKVHGRWKSDSANDGYVCDKADSRLFVPLNIGI